MFEDKLKEIIQSVYSGKVIVFSNYNSRESLYAKGITPSIFLHHYYERKYQQNKVFYVVKEKGFREMCDIFPIDVEEYECFKDEKMNKYIKDKVASQYKYPKEITKYDLINKQLCEHFLKSLHFYWFEQACRIFLYAMALDQGNHNVSTLEQPIGITFMIEIQPVTNIKHQYQKIKKQADMKIKKMFAINPLRMKTIPILVIILYNCEKKVDFSHATAACSILRKEFNIDSNLIFCIEINSPNSKDIVDWSNYPRPLIRQQYKLKPSDPIRLIGDNQQNLLRQNINNHKEKIKQHIEDRLLFLSKRYEESNTAKNKIFNFFKGTPINQRSYNQEQSQSRQIADLLFMLGDYKRCLDLYKNLAQKFEPNDRDQLIFYNVSEMIQLSKALYSLTNNSSKQKSYESIIKYAQKFMLKKSCSIHKYKLHRYLIILLYCMHGFKIFDKQFIKNLFYYYIKKSVNDQVMSPTNPFPSVVPSLIHEQYANLNLLLPVPEYRRYCYDLVRVGSKFNEFRLYQHHLRCLIISNYIYDGTFPILERYVNLALSKACLQTKNARQALLKYKKTWRIMINSYEESANNNQQETEFVKFSGGNAKIIGDIERLDPNQIYVQEDDCIPVPRLIHMLIELKDEAINNQQNLGATWQQVGDIFLQKPQLTSKGMNKQYMMKMLKMFDSISPEDKQLAHRIRNLSCSNGISQPILKRNSRVAFVNQPMIFTFDMKNTLPNAIQISKIVVHLKTPKKCKIINCNLTQQDKYVINQAHIQSFTFQIIPYEAGLYEFSHVSWIFSKITSIYRFKQPWETKSNMKSLYHKINVLEETGRLQVNIKLSHKHFEGQITQIQFCFTNQGKDPIDQIYLAIDNQNIFGFKIKNFDLSILPGQTVSKKLEIRIPLFDNKVQSNYWKCVNKSIFLYKTGSSFRTIREVTVFNIYRIADIYNIVCERLSKNLHLMSFSVKYQNVQQQNLNILKSLVIDGGLEIKKIETNCFGLSIVQYFFFLRRSSEIDLEQYKFNMHDLNSKKIIQQNSKGRLKKTQLNQFNNQNGDDQYKQNKLQLYFLWMDNESNFGIIDPKPIKITPTENTASKVKLPFNVKIMLQDQKENDFEQNPCLQQQIQFRIKNIFDPKPINVTVELVQNSSNSNNDFYWEGITHHMLNLRYNEESAFRLKLIIFKTGIYNIAKNIRYIISFNKVNSHTINHSEYENLFLIVKGKKQSSNFDFFQQFEKNAGFKKVKEDDPIDLL